MELNGVWAYDQTQVLDDKTAIARGHVRPDGTAALHGTWTRIHHFVVHQTKDRTLFVFDEDGRFARFAADATDPLAWAAVSDAWAFTSQDANTGDVPPGVTAKVDLIAPSLVLAVYDEDSVPSGCEVGDPYVTFSDDPNRIAAQRLNCSKDGARFTWSVADGSISTTFFAIAPQQGPPTGNSFSDTFAGATEFSQTAFPFYGFNPLKMPILSEGNAFELPGTPSEEVAFTSNPGQTFIAPLIFEFPAADSTDYVRSPDISKQPNLPIGRRWLPITTSAQSQNTEILSSVADRFDSWSTTLGLSGGVEGMFSLGGDFGYHDKIEQQTTTESRYVVSRDVEISGVNIIHTPSLSLHPALLSMLADCTDAVIAGKPPDWKSFVGHFGSHYLHAMTYGTLKYGETRLTLDAELHAETAGFDLDATAEGTLDGGNLKTQDKYAQEWSTKLQSSLSKEDVECNQIGGPGADAVGILFDLRPISELLSPVLVEYNPADDRQQLAPFVWSDVRKSLEAYLTSKGLGLPLSDELAADYRPRTIRVSVGRPSITVTAGSPDWQEQIVGGIVLLAADTTDVQKTLQFGPPAVPIMADVAKIAEFPDELTYCVIAVRAKAQPRVEVQTSLGIVPPAWEMDALDDVTRAKYIFKDSSVVATSVPEGGSGAAQAGPIASSWGWVVHDGTLALALPLTFKDVTT